MLEVKDYQESQCDCETCVQMCQRFPCRLLPSDLEKMSTDVRLRLCLNYVYGKGCSVYHLQAAPVGYERAEFPSSSYGFFGFGQVPERCTFLSNDGKCGLHGKCKPFEGRVANCDKSKYPEGHAETRHDLGFPDRLSELLFEAWDTDEGRVAVETWKKEVNFEEES